MEGWSREASPYPDLWRKAAGYAHCLLPAAAGHTSPEGEGLSLAKAGMQASITARTQTRPIYHTDARGTIRLLVATWEDNRHDCLEGPGGI